MNDTLNLSALIQLSSASIGYVPWTVSSMRPAAITCVINEVIVNGRSHVIELGAGLSTLYLLWALSQLDEKVSLISIEHDGTWLSKMKHQVAKKGLNDSIWTPVCASLRPVKSEVSTDLVDWYDLNLIDKCMELNSCDFLVIDGPPAHSRELTYSRAPALDFLVDSLQENATIIVDDYNREGEAALVAAIQKLPGWRLDYQSEDANLAILRRGRIAYNII